MTNRANPHKEQYRSTEKQVSFFFTVIISKPIQKSGEQLSLATATAQYAQDQSSNGITQLVNRSLGKWGGTVTALQMKEEHAWRLLQLQTRNAIIRTTYNLGCVERLDLVELAVADNLPKIFEMLGKMVPASEIESTEDAVGFAVEKQDKLRGTYDFEVPIYRYTNKMGQNRFIDLLRKEQRRKKREVHIDELEQTIFATDQFVTEEEFTKAEQKLVHTFHRLLDQISQQLPKVKREVILHTLAMRPQFWHLLEFLNITRPAELPNAYHYTDDVSLAKGLNMTVTSIRSNRSQAKTKIIETDPELGMLMELLLAAR